jgi:hypothetical protein
MREHDHLDGSARFGENGESEHYVLLRGKRLESWFKVRRKQWSPESRLRNLIFFHGLELGVSSMNQTKSGSEEELFGFWECIAVLERQKDSLWKNLDVVNLDNAERKK